MKKCVLIISITIYLGMLLVGCTSNRNEESESMRSSQTENTSKEELNSQCESTESSNISSDIELTEFVLSDYKPTGYSDYIGAALAIKMSIHKEEADYRYSVLLYQFSGERDMYDCVEELNTQSDIAINTSSWVDVTTKVEDDNITTQKLYAQLTYVEIMHLAQNGIWCNYVGTGESPHTEADLTTNEGLEALCEYLGDQYVGNADRIVSHPDMLIELLNP